MHEVRQTRGTASIPLGAARVRYDAYGTSRRALGARNVLSEWSQQIEYVVYMRYTLVYIDPKMKEKWIKMDRAKEKKEAAR